MSSSDKNDMCALKCFEVAQCFLVRIDKSDMVGDEGEQFTYRCTGIGMDALNRGSCGI